MSGAESLNGDRFEDRIMWNKILNEKTNGRILFM